MADDTTQAELAPDPPKVFISYSHQDSTVAEQLRRLLEGRGLRVWFDQGEIALGASIADFAWRGIDDADAVVFLLSPESVHSPWVSMELAAALSLRSEHPAKKIIPVMVGTDVKMPPLLYDTKFVTIDTEDSVEKASSAIVGAIKKTEISSSATEATANAFRMLEARTDVLRAEERAWIYESEGKLVRSVARFATILAFTALMQFIIVPYTLATVGDLHGKYVIVSGIAGGVLIAIVGSVSFRPASLINFRFLRTWARFRRRGDQ